MGQVPTIQKPYLIVGGGRLATHLSHYFDLLDVSFYQWTRHNVHPLSIYLDVSEKVLLAVSDDAIEPLTTTIPNNKKIHFSGALVSSHAESAHPLFTFGQDLYELGTYQSIPFVTEKGKSSFSDLFPELNNPSYEIDSKEKPLYHTWTSMAGNFSSVLIMEYAKNLKDINLPPSIAKSFLIQVLENSLQNSDALTGPIVRGDEKTIQKHLSLLDEEDAQIYHAFKQKIEKSIS